MGDRLPVTLTRDNIYKYYTLVKISAYFYNNELRLLITIPIVHLARKFHIYKVIQAPEVRDVNVNQSHPNANVNVFPEKTTEYIGFSESMQCYILPSERVLSECTGPPNVICNYIHLLYPIKSGDRCITKMQFPYC